MCRLEGREAAFRQIKPGRPRLWGGGVGEGGREPGGVLFGEFVLLLSLGCLLLVEVGFRMTRMSLRTSRRMMISFVIIVVVVGMMFICISILIYVYVYMCVCMYVCERALARVSVFIGK